MHLIGSVCLCGLYFGRLPGTKQPPEKGKREEAEEVKGKGYLTNTCTFMAHPRRQRPAFSFRFSFSMWFCKVSNWLKEGKEKKNNIPVHIVWMTGVNRRRTHRYFIWLCSLRSAPLLAARESHLSSLTSALLWLTANAGLCMCAWDRCSPSDRSE